MRAHLRRLSILFFITAAWLLVACALDNTLAQFRLPAVTRAYRALR